MQHYLTWNALVFIAIAELNGINKTITATPASTEGPKALIQKERVSCCTKCSLQSALKQHQVTETEISVDKLSLTQ